MEAVCLHNFQATADDELSFNKGDVINIIIMEDDPNWYLAELGVNSGLVPCNYIEMRPHPWYIPNCSREEAEDRLLERYNGEYVQPNGAFIVRRSQGQPHGFSLSAKSGNEVIHFKVLQDDQKKFFLWVYKFSSINSLVEHHRAASISRTSHLVLNDRVTSKKYDVKGAPIRRVIANFDFRATETDELNFKRGDVIIVLGEEDENWWIGELDGRQGLFPANYVGPLPSSTSK